MAWGNSAVSPTEVWGHACIDCIDKRLNQTSIANFCISIPRPSEPPYFFSFELRPSERRICWRVESTSGTNDVDQSPGAQVVKCQRSEVQKQRAVRRNGRKNMKKQETSTAAGGGHTVTKSNEKKNQMSWKWMKKGIGFLEPKRVIWEMEIWIFDSRPTGTFWKPVPCSTHKALPTSGDLNMTFPKSIQAENGGVFKPASKSYI